MKLYISTDTNSTISDPSFSAPVTSFAFKRGDAATLEIAFVSNYATLEVVDGMLISFGLKAVGDYDGALVVAASDYVVSENFYVLAPNFNTTALNDLLEYDGTLGNDVASVSLMGEITWSSDGGTTWSSTNTFTANISNDVIRTGESVPAATAAGYATNPPRNLNDGDLSSFTITGANTFFDGDWEVAEFSSNIPYYINKTNDGICGWIEDSKFWDETSGDGAHYHSNTTGSYFPVGSVTSWTRVSGTVGTPAMSNKVVIQTTPGVFLISGAFLFYKGANGLWYKVTGTEV